MLLRYEAEDVIVPLVARLAARAARSADGPGARLERLDALPLPAWDLVDVEAYFRFHEAVVAGLGRPSWAFPIAGRSLPMLTSRGCPYRCVHCSSNPTSRRDGRLVAPKTQRRYSPDYLGAPPRPTSKRAARGASTCSTSWSTSTSATSTPCSALLVEHDLALRGPERDARRLPPPRRTSRR